MGRRDDTHAESDVADTHALAMFAAITFDPDVVWVVLDEVVGDLFDGEQLTMCCRRPELPSGYTEIQERLARGLCGRPVGVKIRMRESGNRVRMWTLSGPPAAVEYELDSIVS